MASSEASSCRSSADLEESETTDSSQVDSDDATSLLVSARRHLRFLRESDLLRQNRPVGSKRGFFTCFLTWIMDNRKRIIGEGKRIIG